MLTRLWIVLSCLPLALLVGCGGGSSAAKCVAGATAECACPGQQSGVQTCTSAGTFAACVCATPTTDAGNAGGADGAVTSPPDVAAMRAIDGPIGTGGVGGREAGGEGGSGAGGDAGVSDVPVAEPDATMGGAGGGTTSSGGATSTGGISGAGGTSGGLGGGDAGVRDAPVAQPDAPIGGSGGGAGGIGGAGGTTSSAGGTTSATGGATANGCSTCSTGLVCERYDNACLDPNWDEWPIPNDQADVTAGAPNLESYTDNRDGTITDNVTGLMWQQAVPSATYAWVNAVAYCPTLTLAGHSDWRLPSVIELVSIVDLGQSYPPSINGTYFPSSPATYFWSSSPVAFLPSHSWYVRFDGGETSGNLVTYPYNVRCVR